MRRLTPFFILILLVLCAVLPAAVRWVQFHDIQNALTLERWTQPEPTRPAPDYTAAGVPLVVTPTSRQFTDQPAELGGTVVLDMAHDNNFTLEELDYLRSRLAARNTELQLFENGDLGGALRGAQSLIIIAPLANYSADEVTAVRAFVERGGRLLLIGDPTRFEVELLDQGFTFEILFNTADLPLNQLATEFDLTFQGDYLYNTSENEGNYANIIINEGGLAEDEMTNGLSRVALYGTHSLQLGNAAKPLLTADEQTFSSDTNRANNVVLAASSADGRVLAIGDINFLAAPYFTTFDNGRFITNMADFLATDSRSYVLSDLPYLYQQPVDLLYIGGVDLGASLFDQIILLQRAWEAAGKSLQLAAAPQPEHDALYLGLYNQTLDTDIEAALADAGVELLIDPPILTAEEERELLLQMTPTAVPTETPPAEEGEDAPTPTPSPTPIPPPPAERLIVSDELGQIKMSGTTLILFREEESGSRTVIVLAASQEGLDNSVERLASLAPAVTDYGLGDCLLAETYALCPSNVADEEVEAELISGPVEAVEADADEADTEPDETDEADDDDTAVDEPDEDVDEPDDEPTGPTLEEIEYEIVGSVGVDENVSDTLPENMRHGWEFNDGPAVVDITLSGEDEFDAVLEIYDPDGYRIAFEDSNFNNDPETISGQELGEGVYTIIVADYYDAGGPYTLDVVSSDEDTAEEGEEGEEGEAEESDEETDEATDEEEEESEDSNEQDESDADVSQIFVYQDDDGELLYPALADFTDFTAVLTDSYTVTTWSANDDGSLEEINLLDYDMVVWDSGGYRDEAGAAEDDGFDILSYSFDGGYLLAVGLVPPLLEPTDLALLQDVEVVGDNELFPLEIESGTLFELDDSYEAAVLDITAEEDDGVTFLVRGPNSELAGDVIGSVFAEEEPSSAKIGILSLPLQALTAEDQDTLLNAVVNWYFSPE